MNNWDRLNQRIERLLQEQPDLAKALELFDMGMKEYAEAFRFLNEPQIITSDNTNELIQELH